MYSKDITLTLLRDEKTHKYSHSREKGRNEHNLTIKVFVSKTWVKTEPVFSSKIFISFINQGFISWNKKCWYRLISFRGGKVSKGLSSTRVFLTIKDTTTQKDGDNDP